jgi:hypothetical protein
MQLKQAINLMRQMGPAWVAGRAGYAARRKLGWLERRCPAQGWAAYEWRKIAPQVAPDALRELLCEAGGRFFVNPDNRLRYQTRLREIVAPDAEQRLNDEIAALKRGEWQLFSSHWRQVGWPVRWHVHPETGAEWPLAHWSKITDLGGSDVKWLWEIGRFAPVYALLRAYWLTGDAAHAETFWQLAEGWREQNPPNRGAHWMCGQEASFRVLAWLCGLFGFLDAPATTDARLVSMMEMLAAHGRRVRGNIGYALAQKNNHSVNEALGLWLLGALFPFLPDAAAWERDGRRFLEREAARQIYPDGAYVQQSINYHRLILQSYAVALRVGELCGRPFSAELKSRYRRAAEWLWQVTDAASGHAPNYGSNDGAALLKLDGADFADMRPTLAAAFWLTDKASVFNDKASQERLLWLCGEEALDAPAAPRPQSNLSADTGGYYTIRGAETWAFTRCGVYRDRPAQADMLHADLWWRGHNLVADPGTFSYNSPAPWRNGLAATRVHNCPSADGLDQMERGPRFTWFYWTRGRVMRREAKLFVGEHDGYRRRLGVAHRRVIWLANEWLWVIADELAGAGEHDLSAQWLFPAAEIVAREGNGFHLRTPAGECRVWFATFAPQSVTTAVDIAKGPPDDTLGWFAPRYLDKVAALGLVVRDRCALPARRVTVLALDAAARLKSCTESELQVTRGADKFAARWREDGSGALNIAR